MASSNGACKFLGAFDKPVLVFGGAYSNKQALEAVLKVGKDLNIPPERTIHTGDVVAYCAHPRETSELLQSSGVHCLMGNCEESISMGSGDCGCGFEEGSACDEYSKNWFAHVMKEFKNTPQLAVWMGAMPRRMEFTIGKRRFAVVHGSPSHISGWIWTSMKDRELLAEFGQLGANIDGIISGHSGIPFVKLLKNQQGLPTHLWLNAGVIGMPANDGTQRGWYALMTPRGEDLDVSIHGLEFDAKAAADAIHARPALNRGYGDALITGIWPSHDVLPLVQQMETGVALEEQRVTWLGEKRSSCSKPAVVASLVLAAALVAVLGARRS